MTDEQRRKAQEPQAGAPDSPASTLDAIGEAGSHGPDRCAVGAETPDERHAKEEELDAVWSKYWSLKFDIDRSRRYHMALERHYAAWNSRIRLVSLAASSAAAASFFLESAAGAVLALVVTVAQLANNQYRLTEKAGLHTRLRQQYASLFAKLVRSEHEVLAGADLGQVHDWVSEYESIFAESDEVGMMTVVNAKAHNDVVRSMDGDESEMFALTPVQSALACYFDIAPAALRKRKAIQSPTD